MERKSPRTDSDVSQSLPVSLLVCDCNNCQSRQFSKLSSEVASDSRGYLSNFDQPVQLYNETVHIPPQISRCCPSTEGGAVLSFQSGCSPSAPIDSPLGANSLIGVPNADVTASNAVTAPTPRHCETFQYLTPQFEQGSRRTDGRSFLKRQTFRNSSKTVIHRYRIFLKRRRSIVAILG